MREMVWPREARFSMVHLRACWLPLSLSIATATEPFPVSFFPPLFAFGSHIISLLYIYLSF